MIELLRMYKTPFIFKMVRFTHALNDHNHFKLLVGVACLNKGQENYPKFGVVRSSKILNLDCEFFQKMKKKCELFDSYEYNFQILFKASESREKLLLLSVYEILYQNGASCEHHQIP